MVVSRSTRNHAMGQLTLVVEVLIREGLFLLVGVGFGWRHALTSRVLVVALERVVCGSARVVAI